ncbi:MAG: GNAT family N-acetyltransferase [Proteobacteria bacterium]|nr:GNAT family N-acetyltransferase [Pseudomonadota bacterium]
MRVGIEIRGLRSVDRAQWQVLWDGYNAFYGRSGPTALDPHITELTWGRFLDPREPMHALVADDGGRIVGIVHYLYHRSTTRAADICYLQDLFTVPAQRGQGIGRRLIAAVVEAARKAGSSRVYWQTKADNATARALYDRVAEHSGFIVYATEISAPGPS